MVEIHDSLVKTLEENTELYKIINSKDHLAVLEEIFKKNIAFEDIKKNTYIKKDNILYNILSTLTQKELIKEIEVNNNKIYYITDSGEKLVKLCQQARKEYNL
jgi:DNA-binding HxlR family transcriptional regulator